MAGLVRLLADTLVQLCLLRSDLSVIEAVAFGASMGAVGTSTGLRHNYPAVGDGPGFRPDPSIGALVPQSMGYRTLQKINAAIDADPDNQPRWRCNCRFCGDTVLTRIVSEVQAFQHSLAATAVLGEKILTGDSTLKRQHAWVCACQHAQYVNLEIAAETAMSWEPPAYLAGWQKLARQLPALTPAV